MLWIGSWCPEEDVEPFIFSFSYSYLFCFQDIKAVPKVVLWKYILSYLLNFMVILGRSWCPEEDVEPFVF